MKTILCLGLLVAFGAILGGLVGVLVLNLAGVPGALLAGFPGKRSRRRFIFGSVVSAIGQSYVYLGFVAFVCNWTAGAANRPDVVGFPLWPVAFLAVMGPIWFNLIRARVEAQEQGTANVQVEALHITVVVAFVGFLVFSFAPQLMACHWGWVPYVD